MKIANTDRELLHILWSTWGNSMTFSGKMWLMTILKVAKNQGLSLSSEENFFEKPQERRGSNWSPSPSRFRAKTSIFILFYLTKNMLFGNDLQQIVFLQKVLCVLKKVWSSTKHVDQVNGTSYWCICH